MGTYLYLVLPEEQQTDERIIDQYYDFVASKERKYFPDCAKEDLSAHNDREIKRIGFEEEQRVYLYEQITSNVKDNVDLRLREVFGSDINSTGDRIVYGEDINQAISQLREGKRRLKQKGDAHRWEMTFELRLIAICEFALENGYGIELS